MAVIRIIAYTMEHPGSNPIVAWQGAGVRLVVPHPHCSFLLGEESFPCVGSSRRCSAGGQSPGGGCQPHFTKPLVVLRRFFLHHSKCLTFWNMSKKEDFPLACLACGSGTTGVQEGPDSSSCFVWSAVGSPTQVYPSPVTSLPGNRKVSQPPFLKSEN